MIEKLEQLSAIEIGNWSFQGMDMPNQIASMIKKINEIIEQLNDNEVTK